MKLILTETYLLLVAVKRHIGQFAHKALALLALLVLGPSLPEHFSRRSPQKLN